MSQNYVIQINQQHQQQLEQKRIQKQQRIQEQQLAQKQRLLQFPQQRKHIRNIYTEYPQQQFGKNIKEL